MALRKLKVDELAIIEATLRSNAGCRTLLEVV